MYKNSLNSDEQLLFSGIVNNSTRPIFTEIQPAIDATRATTKAERTTEKQDRTDERDLYTVGSTEWKAIDDELKLRKYWDLTRWDPQPLTDVSNLFFNEVGSKKTTGAVIQQWLQNMLLGVDLMSAKSNTKLSASQGIRKVATDTNDKDYKKAQFEVRIGPTIPADEWVQYAKTVFNEARVRGGDTPDDRATKKNESSKTGLKK